MSPIVVTEIETVDSWCLTTPVSGFSVKCQWELWNGDWWDLKAPAGSCASAESGENQIVLTGCSCDWQSVVATRSVGRTRSAGGGITGNKTGTCPTKRWEQMCRRANSLQMHPSDRIPLTQAGFNEEKANKVVITAAQVFVSKRVVSSWDENAPWCHLGTAKD